MLSKGVYDAETATSKKQIRDLPHNNLIQELYKAEKTSIRQLARVLGVSKGMVERTL